MSQRVLASLSNIETLSPLVTRILGQNPGPKTLQGTNTYLVGRGSEVALIDTGEPNKPSYIELVSELVSVRGLHITSIIATHWHHDHIGGCGDVLKMLESKGHQVPPVYKYPHPLDSHLLDCEICEVYDNQVIEVTQGVTLKLYHTPGHTDDSITLHLLQENSVFCGDTILGGSSGEFDNYLLYMKSLEKLRDIKPDIIYTGHGIVESTATIDKYIAHRLNREVKVRESLKSQDVPVSVEHLMEDVYKDDNLTHPALISAAQRIVGLILEKLKNDEVAIVDENNLWSSS